MRALKFYFQSPRGKSVFGVLVVGNSKNEKENNQTDFKIRNLSK